MSEAQPFKGEADKEPKLHLLKGPNVISTFDCPPHPDAIKAHDAAIRRYLQDRKPRQGQQPQE